MALGATRTVVAVFEINWLKRDVRIKRPAITAVGPIGPNFFIKTNANFLYTEVYSNVKNFYAYLVDIFEEGRKSGEMKADLNSRAARDIFVGTMDHVISRWLLKDMSYSLFDNLENIFELMVGAFKAKNSI